MPANETTSSTDTGWLSIPDIIADGTTPQRYVLALAFIAVSYMVIVCSAVFTVQMLRDGQSNFISSVKAAVVAADTQHQTARAIETAADAVSASGPVAAASWSQYAGIQHTLVADLLSLQTSGVLQGKPTSVEKIGDEIVALMAEVPVARDTNDRSESMRRLQTSEHFAAHVIMPEAAELSGAYDKSVSKQEHSLLADLVPAALPFILAALVFLVILVALQIFMASRSSRTFDWPLLAATVIFVLTAARIFLAASALSNAVIQISGQERSVLSLQQRSTKSYEEQSYALLGSKDASRAAEQVRSFQAAENANKRALSDEQTKLEQSKEALNHAMVDLPWTCLSAALLVFGLLIVGIVPRINRYYRL